MKIGKLEPIISTTKKGKKFKRYDIQVQKSVSPNTPNINIGVTPSGTRYYRALLPDKSWGTTFLRTKDGTETIIDSCRAPYGLKTTVESRKEKLVLSNKVIEHYTNAKSGVYNSISENSRVGQASRAYIDNDIYQYMYELKDNVDYSKMKPPKKPNRLLRLFKKSLSQLFVS